MKREREKLNTGSDILLMFGSMLHRTFNIVIFVSALLFRYMPENSARVMSWSSDSQRERGIWPRWRNTTAYCSQLDCVRRLIAKKSKNRYESNRNIASRLDVVRHKSRQSLITK